MFTSKRRSFFTGDQNIQIEEKSPDDGEAGSDDVVKRNKSKSIRDVNLVHNSAVFL